MDTLPIPDIDRDLEDLPGIDDVLAFILADDTPAVLGPMPTASETLFSRKISIRVPNHVLSALRANAAVMGIPYQTLINHILALHVAGLTI